MKAMKSETLSLPRRSAPSWAPEVAAQNAPVTLRRQREPRGGRLRLLFDAFQARFRLGRAGWALFRGVHVARVGERS